MNHLVHLQVHSVHSHDQSLLVGDAHVPGAGALPSCDRSPVEMEKYRAINQQLLAIWSRWAPLVEPVGLDEAYLDVSQTRALQRAPEQVAYSLQSQIRSETALDASVGLGTSNCSECEPSGNSRACRSKA